MSRTTKTAKKRQPATPSLHRQATDLRGVEPGRHMNEQDVCVQYPREPQDDPKTPFTISVMNFSESTGDRCSVDHGLHSSGPQNQKRIPMATKKTTKRPPTRTKNAPIKLAIMGDRTWADLEAAMLAQGTSLEAVEAAVKNGTPLPKALPLPGDPLGVMFGDPMDELIAVSNKKAGGRA